MQARKKPFLVGKDPTLNNVDPVLIKNIIQFSIFLSTLRKNTEISPSFLVWKFCGNVYSPQNFGQLAQISAENVRFRKIPHQEIRCNSYFMQCK